MAKGFDVLYVKSAVKSRNEFDLSRTHLTTMDFGEIVPLFNEETIPGDSISVNGNYFSRMAPLVKPTYGKFSFRTAAFFVPYHQIADDADAFMAGIGVWEGVSVHQRFITIGSLFTFAYNNSTAVNSGEDFVYLDGSGNLTKRKFTNKGRYYFKVLNALGYVIPQGIDLQSASYWSTNYKNRQLSAYPLLAFFKAYNDYMSQSQRFNVSQLSAFLKAVKHGNAITGFSFVTGEVQYSGIQVMFDNLKLTYDNDYFTSAWQSANNALTVQQQGAGVWSGNVPVSQGNEVIEIGDNFNNLRSQLTDGTEFQFSQRALDWLKAFDDWVRRNNYSGSRSVQKVYSRFGIKTDDYRSNYAHVLGTDVIPIQVGDVTATANETNVKLGDYAGKAIMNGSKGFTCKADDYGLFMVFGYFTITPMNPYGFDRKVLRVDALDYYNPEFDGLGADAISKGEYFSSPIVDPSSDNTKDTDVYGFTERYNAYRFGRDQITGEFRSLQPNAAMNVWHTGRNLSTVRQAGNLVAQSSDVVTLPQVDSEYNRIFSITSDAVNHFYLTCQFNVSAIRPMLNLNQVVQLGEGNTTLPRNGNEIN